MRQGPATHRPAIKLLDQPVQLLRLPRLDGQRLQARLAHNGVQQPSERAAPCVRRSKASGGGGAPPAGRAPRGSAFLARQASQALACRHLGPTWISGSSAASSSRSGRLVRCSLAMADSSGSVLPCGEGARQGQGRCKGKVGRGVAAQWHVSVRARLPTAWRVLRDAHTQRNPWPPLAIISRCLQAAWQPTLMAMQTGQVKRRWPRIWLWLSPTQREWNQPPQPSHAIMAAQRAQRTTGV